MCGVLDCEPEAGPVAKAVARWDALDLEAANGPIEHLAPVLRLSETPPRWERPSPRLGGDAAQWLAPHAASSTASYGR